MALSIATGANPAFLSPNYINRFADRGNDLAVSSGGTLKHRLYDNDPEAQFSSAGSDDSTIETITSGLWRPGAQLSRDVDFWAVLNHNLSDITVERSNNDGSSYTTQYTDAAIAAAEVDTREVLGSTTAIDKLKISAQTTKTAGDEKLIGALYVAKLRFQSAEPFYEYKPKPWRFGHKSSMMHDKTISSVPIFRSDASFKHYSADVKFIVDITDGDSELVNFQTMAFDPEPFLFMPYPGDRVRDIWLCRVKPNTYDDGPLLKSTPNARLVEFTVEEVGRS